jgi:mannose-6-phosphate isomerase-like protein (cupin superfamily)
MTVRRVVTARSADGRSVIAGDVKLQPVTVSALPGYEWHRLWGTDESALVEFEAGTRPVTSHFPPPGGVRFNIFVVPPASAAGPVAPSEADQRELEAKLPGRSEHMEADEAGMHATASVDFICVLNGEIWLELDEGEVHLRAGDTVVQNATRHAWRNKGVEPCRLAICLVGLPRSVLDSA